MLPAAREWNTADAERARRNFLVRNARLATGSRKDKPLPTPPDAARRRRRAAVDAALARARSRRTARSVADA
jgi:hypothetical protein